MAEEVISVAGTQVVKSGCNPSLLQGGFITKTVLCGAFSVFATVATVIIVNYYADNLGPKYPVALPDYLVISKNSPTTFNPLENDSAEENGPKGKGVTLHSVGTPRHGVLSRSACVGEGCTNLVYSPNIGWAGIEVFTYNVTNGMRTSETNITITVVNTPPVAGNFSMTVPRSETKTIDVLKYCSDADKDDLVLLNVTSSTLGVASIVFNQLKYTPHATALGTEKLTYFISDLNNTAWGVITMNIIRTPPNAVDDSYTTKKNVPLVLDILANDSDQANLPIELSRIVSPPQYGTAVITGDVIQYAPNWNFLGIDTLQYEISTEQGKAIATVTIEMGPWDMFANTFNVTVPKNSERTNILDPSMIGFVIPENVTAGYTLPTLQVYIESFPMRYNLTEAQSPSSIYFSPEKGTSYSDEITYLISADGVQAVGTIYITVVNYPPEPRNQTFAVQRNSVANSLLVDLTNSDRNGDNVVLVATEEATYGTAGLENTTAVTYRPAPGFVGVDTFIFVVNDSDDSCAEDTAKCEILAGQATASVTVVNTAPVAVADSFVVHRNSEAVSFDVLANDTDADGDEPRFQILYASAPFGHVEIAADENGYQTLLYTPSRNMTYNETITYTLGDQDTYTNLTSQGTVSVTIINTAPSCANTTAQVTWNQQLVLNAVQVAVLDNSSDPNGDNVWVKDISQGTYGTVSTDSLSATYTPATGFVGTDTFSFNCWDGEDVSAETSYVTVEVLNSPPVAVDDGVFNINYLQEVSLTEQVLSNDSDPEGNRLVVVDASGDESVLNITVTDDNRLLVTAKDVGELWFTYTASDGNLASSPANVTLLATGAPITAAYHTKTYKWRDLLTGQTVEDITEGATYDLDHSRLHLFSTTNDTVNNVISEVAGPASIRVQSQTNFVGTASLLYVLSDGFNTSTFGKLTVISTNEEPQTADYSATFQYDNEDDLQNNKTIDLSDYLTDADGDDLWIKSVTSNLNSVTIAGPKSLVYTLSSKKGEDTFSYIVTDSISDVPGRVTITTANNPPIAVDDVGHVKWSPSLRQSDRKVSLSVVANDTDVNGDSLILLSADETSAQGGTLTFESQLVTYTPPNDFVGEDTFSYVVSDGEDSSTGHVTIHVENNQPTAIDDVFTIVLDQLTEVDVLSNDYDVDGDNIYISEAPQDQEHITFVFDDGKLFAKATKLSTQTFDYVVNDTKLASTPARVTITVTSPTISVPSVEHTSHWSLWVTGQSVALVQNETCHISAIRSAELLGMTAEIDEDTTKSKVEASSGFVGTKTFAFVAACQVGEEIVDTIEATVVIESTNTPPTCTAIEITFDRAAYGDVMQVPITVACVDAHGDPISVEAVQQKSNVAINGDLLSINYTIVTHEAPDTFTVTVSDGVQTSTVDVTVNVNNNEPTAVADALDSEGKQFQVVWNQDANKNNFVLIDVLHNDWDVNNDTVSIAAGSITQPKSKDDSNVVAGTAETRAEYGNMIRFTPAAGFVGEAVFSYKASDGKLESNSATVSVLVTNDRPTVVNNEQTKYAVSYDTESEVSIGRILSDISASDVNADTLTLMTPSNTDKLQFRVDSDRGMLLVKPSDVGEFIFTVKVTDNNLESSLASVSVSATKAPIRPADKTVTEKWGLLVAPNSSKLSKAQLVAGAQYPVANEAGRLKLFGITASGLRKFQATANLDESSITVQLIDNTFIGTEIMYYQLTDGFSPIMYDGKITITSTNTAPTTVLREETFSYDPVNSQNNIKEITLTSADMSDADEDTVSIKSVRSNVNSVTASGAKKLTYTVTSKKGADQFTYVATDTIADVTGRVTVTTTNNKPVAVDDSGLKVNWNPTGYTTLKTVTISPLTNDFDYNGDALTIRTVGSTSLGVTSKTDTAITFTPKTGLFQTAPITFTYTVFDGTDESAPATISVLLQNTAPTVSSPSFQLVLGQASSVPVLNSARDPDADPIWIGAAPPNTSDLTFELTDQKTLMVTTYTLSAVKFTVSITDGVYSTPMEVTITATKPDITIPPTTSSKHWLDWRSQEQTFTVISDSSCKISSFDTSSLKYGVTVVKASDTTFKVTTPSAYVDSHSFVFVPSCKRGNENIEVTSVTVTLRSTNAKPSCTAVVASFPNAALNQVVQVPITVSCSDSNQDSLSLSQVPQSMAISNDKSSVLYKIPSTKSEVLFTVTVTDGAETTTVQVSVTAPNTPPTAVADTVDRNGQVLTCVWNQDSSKTNSLIIDVLYNDWDTNNDTLTVSSSSVTQPKNKDALSVSVGSATLQVDNKIRFVPAAGFVGTAVFNYAVSDGLSVSNVVTVTVLVQNRQPVAQNRNNLPVTFNKKTDITTTTIITNDPRATDPDGDTLYVVNPVSSNVQDLEVQMSADGTKVEVLAKKTGLLTFTVSISDNNKFATATVSVMVSGAPITANNDQYNIYWSKMLSKNGGVRLTVLDNDEYPLGNDKLSIISASTIANAQITVIENNRVLLLKYNDAGMLGQLPPFTYTVTDGYNNKVASVSVTSSCINFSGVDDSYTTHWRNPSFGVLDVLANDKNLDGIASAMVIESIAKSPTTPNVVINNGKTLQYPLSQPIVDNFKYKLADGLCKVDVNVRVEATNSAPIANDVTFATVNWNGGSFTSTKSLAELGASDPNGDAISVSQVTSPSYGTATAYVYTAKYYANDPSVQVPQLFSGQGNVLTVTDVYTYTVSDRFSTATASVRVNLRNTRPQPQADVCTVEKGVSTDFSCNLVGNDQDAETDPLSVLSVSPSNFFDSNGVLIASVVPDAGSIFIAPTRGITKDVTLTYTVTDRQLTNTGSVTIKLKNTAPTCRTTTADYSTPKRAKLIIALDRYSCTDVNGDFLTITGLAKTSSQSGITLVTSADKLKIEYTAAGAAYTDKVTFYVTDGEKQSQQLTANINVINYAPTGVTNINPPAISTSSPSIWAYRIDLLQNPPPPNTNNCVPEPPAENAVITATIRDFRWCAQSINNFQPTGCLWDMQNVNQAESKLVKKSLGADKKPVFNNVEYGVANAATKRSKAKTVFNGDTFDLWYNTNPTYSKVASVDITLSKLPGSNVYSYRNDAFFPFDNRADTWGNQGYEHNYHFTTEIHTQFKYENGASFTFEGDDDVWVFINNQLAIDIGGVHGPQKKTVNLDDDASKLGIVRGRMYDLDIFHAERHTYGSNFRMETTLAFSCSCRDQCGVCNGDGSTCAPCSRQNVCGLCPSDPACPSWAQSDPHQVVSVPSTENTITFRASNYVQDPDGDSIIYLDVSGRDQSGAEVSGTVGKTVDIGVAKVMVNNAGLVTIITKSKYGPFEFKLHFKDNDPNQPKEGYIVFYVIIKKGDLETNTPTYTCNGRSPSDPQVCSGRGTCTAQDKCTCTGATGQFCGNAVPDCSKASLSKNTLWSPNHKFETIYVQGITDADGDSLDVLVTSVLSTQGSGNGWKGCPDAVTYSGGRVDLVSERYGNIKDGRTYFVNFVASDGNGGMCTGTRSVCVPHDQGGSSTCTYTTGQTLYDATRTNCPVSTTTAP